MPIRVSADVSRLVAILDGIGECFYALDREWRVTDMNRCAEVHFGRPRDTILGEVIWTAFPGSFETWLGGKFREVMATGEALSLESGSIIVPGRWMEGRIFPIPDGLGIAFRDITAAKRDEASLRRREAELAKVQRIAGIGGLEVDLRRGFENRRSPEYLLLHGLPPDAATESHEAWVARIHPADRVRAEREFKEAVKGRGEHYAAEYRIIRPLDGQMRWIAATAEIERDESGRALRLVGAHRDITERKRAQERQQLLIHELNHRVKNTLATVQSIAAQSLRSGGSIDQGLAAFDGRIFALSRAHDVLTRENWESAELGEIVRQAIEPFRDERNDRFRIEGGDLRLGPSGALAIAMALQELATNAVKYGALSNEAGSVAIRWRLSAASPPRLNLVWTETGGPPVSPPTRRGFGSRLIERTLAQDLDGHVRIEFLPVGIVCTVDAGMTGQPSSDPALYQS